MRRAGTEKVSQGFNSTVTSAPGSFSVIFHVPGLDDEHLSFGVPMPQHPFADSCSHPGEVEGVRVAHSGLRHRGLRSFRSR